MLHEMITHIRWANGPVGDHISILNAATIFPFTTAVSRIPEPPAYPECCAVPQPR